MGFADAEISTFTLVTTYFGYAVLVIFGHLRDLWGILTGKSRYRKELQGKTLVSGWERFYTRRLFNRIQDCWARPVTSRPSTFINIATRNFNQQSLGMSTQWEETSKMLNLGSYNYLGFSDENWMETCGTQVFQSLHQFGVSPTGEKCSTSESLLLQSEIASFCGKEDALLFGTGFSTNAWTLSKLVGPGALILSDALNHTSIVNGCRASGARVLPFQHNDAADLRRLVVEALSLETVPTKILVVVEGLYSMEGHVCELREITKVCQELKLFLYVDEAHSIGALGRTGRGICELAGVDPSQVDVLMGTFTKSFGGLGGYIAASKEICDWLRTQGYRENMSPVVCAQVRRALHILRETELGAQKLVSLKENAKFFRDELIRMGCTVLGDENSPIVPVMLYHPAKIAAFSRECLKRNLAVVVVGSPAVPLMGARARFCLSASHSKQDLIWSLREIRQVAILLNLRYEKSAFG